MPSSTIAENLLRIQERLTRAVEKSHRPTEEITLIGVSKTHPAEAIREAYAAGLRHFGENRVQEWEGKRAGLTDISAECTWHLIGHLQSNKAARAAKTFNSIDSLDDFLLAQKLNRTCSELNPPNKLRVLIEVHIGGEESKTGIPESELTRLAEQTLVLDQLNVQGLMCIPPYAQDPESARPHFAHLRTLKEQLEVRLQRKLPVLSMGMSHDFEVAIEEGATEIRVGTAIFGTRAAA
jgi:pyridoxal phosphate enzyme (YggS family)